MDFGDGGDSPPSAREASGKVRLTAETGKKDPNRGVTRRGFLKAAGAGVAWIAAAGALGCGPTERASKEAPATNATPAPPSTPAPTRPKDVLAFRSRPDLNPPGVGVAVPASGAVAPGYVFVAPKTGPGYEGPVQNGPMIVDNAGHVVWFRPMRGGDVRAMDFKVQQYRGEPVLTWYEGVGTTYGRGEYVIADTSYREVRRVRAGNGYAGDHHEFLITAQDTALITIYSPVRWDLTSIGGPRNGIVLDGIAQEVDIATGEVLFEWHSLDHVGIGESYRAVPEAAGGTFDYFHINSIDVDTDDNLLVSARTTFAVYKIDRRSGEILWRLGGKRSDFEMGPGTWVRYQHDARRQPDGTITVFDNGGVQKDDISYGLVLDLDEDEMMATLAREYGESEGNVAAVMGSMQVLPNGNAFLGWGSEPHFSEFGEDGELLFSAAFPPEPNSYRAFRFPWSGQPVDDPAVAAEPGPADGELTVYASWNGATEVAAWQAIAGPGPGRLEPVGPAADRDGFETAITVRTTQPYVGVQARDDSGRVLGVSEAVRV
jgi:Arylsulfotransferase (ASST)